MENLSVDTLSSQEQAQFAEFKKQKRIEEAVANIQKIECDCLSPYVSRSQLKALCKDANTLELGGIVVPPALVKPCVSFLGKDPKASLIAAISFPNGGDTIDVKRKAVKRAVKDGVDEVEVYAPYFAIKEGSFSYFKRECKKLKKATKHRAVRVALNCQLLTPQELVKSCSIAADIGINCIRLCGSVDSEVLEKVKTAIKDRCLLKLDGAENVAELENALSFGASKVTCKNAPDLARLILSEAKK